MSLKPLQPGVQPLGQFDCLDADVLTIKGGEVMTFGTVTVPGSDAGAADAFDGYLNPNLRTVVQLADGTDNVRMLADDGIAGYGTLFGSVVGGTVGTKTSGTVIGPHTSEGSGKTTCWGGPGLFAVSLDAVNADVTPTDPGVVAGSPLYCDASGLLSVTSNGTTLGTVVEFTTNGSLVTTPNHLVGAFNPPNGDLSGAKDKDLTFVTLWFSP